MWPFYPRIWFLSNNSNYFRRLRWIHCAVFHFDQNDFIFPWTYLINFLNTHVNLSRVLSVDGQINGRRSSKHVLSHTQRGKRNALDGKHLTIFLRSCQGVMCLYMCIRMSEYIWVDIYIYRYVYIYQCICEDVRVYVFVCAAIIMKGIPRYDLSLSPPTPEMLP